MEPRVSAIVPCRNERDNIGGCINSLLENDYNNLEIIVVDGMSTDGTKEIIIELSGKYSNLIILENSRKITPVALNMGLDIATGDYIMIAGAHADFPKNYISVIVKMMSELDNAVGVGGSMITLAGESLKAHSIVKVMTDRLGVGNSIFRIGHKKSIKVDTLPYGLYKREIFENVGKYDERLIRNQDIELSKRILKYGSDLYLIPDVKCHYHFKGNFSHLARSSFSNGLWNILTCYITKKITSLSPRHFVPFMFVLGLIIPAVLSLVMHTSYYYLSVLILGIYLLVITMKSLILKDKYTSFFYLIWSFMILHFAYGIGSLTGLFYLNRLIKR